MDDLIKYVAFKKEYENLSDVLVLGDRNIYEVEEVCDGWMFILKEDEGSTFVEFPDFIDDCIALDKNKKQIPYIQILGFLKEFFPNIEYFNMKEINKYIKVGMKYSFHPTWDTVEFDADKCHKVTSLSTGGLCGTGGFLDTRDFLFECTYFDDNNEKIDITPLRELYLKAFKRK